MGRDIFTQKSQILAENPKNQFLAKMGGRSKFYMECKNDEQKILSELEVLTVPSHSSEASHTAPETYYYRKLMSAPVLFACSQDLSPITLRESIKIFHPAHFEKLRFYARIMGMLPYK